MSHRRVLTSCILAALLASGVLPSPAAAQYIYAVAADGALEWREHLGSPDGSASWVGPRTVGSGWQSFQAVVPAGAGVIYAVRTDGTLLWYKNLGFHDGSFQWADPVAVGSGWQDFRAVFSGGDGILYGLRNDGVLVWYRHLGWLTGANTWEGPRTVGVGWQDFTAVFAGDGGAIYGIQADGTLLWYRHLGRADGSFVWDGPTTVGSSWNGFRQVFASAAGVVYARRFDGVLLWYRHLGYRDGSPTWAGPTTVGDGWFQNTTAAAAATLEGYAWPLSAAPGEAIAFQVSCPADYSVRYVGFQRSGDQNTAIPLTVATGQTAQLQAVPAQPWQTGCGWSPSFQFQVPADWPSGIYAAECTDEVGRVVDIPFVVKPGPDAPGDFAVLANTHTWNAYNDWGGASKYTTPPAHAVSYLRPNPGAAPRDAGGVNHLTRAELWVLDWLATTGYRFDVFTDIDFHAGIPDLAAYRGLILDTHPEYWTLEMLDNLEAYLAGGGCVLYMAGNGIFEQVVLSPDATQLTLFPAGGYPAREPSYFRNLTPPRPERAVLGVAYRYDNYFTFAPLGVLQADHHLFAGTGVVDGQAIGAGGINGGGASGWEMDTSIAGLAPDGVIVSGGGADDRGIPPANLELLARGLNAGGYGADMTYYQTPAGGFVFCAGSISFGGSLVEDPILQQVVRNALAEAYGTVGVSDPGTALAGLGLGANRPNPFRSSTVIRYAVPATGTVRLAVYDLRGREVATLVDGTVAPGEHLATWNGRTRQGDRAAAGVYLYRLDLGGRSGGADGARALTGRMVLTR
ncbi:MAG: DUF6605 domain-containing protein [Candidatus Krumholzibacteriia bacterium]